MRGIPQHSQQIYSMPHKFFFTLTRSRSYRFVIERLESPEDSFGFLEQLEIT